MKVICLGGGPAGLYLGISLKLRNPEHEVEVYERNKPDDTFGWGIVFSDQTVDNITDNDPISAQRIVDEFIHWDLIDCHVSGAVERSGGHGFIDQVESASCSFCMRGPENWAWAYILSKRLSWMISAPGLPMLT